jgi:hypothetical protein
MLDRMKCTPLDDAYREGHKVCALLLEERGGMRAADPNMHDEVGRCTLNQVDP